MRLSSKVKFEKVLPEYLTKYGVKMKWDSYIRDNGSINREIELLNILSEGCKKHPAYRAKRKATGRCLECVKVWQARLELTSRYDLA